MCDDMLSAANQIFDPAAERAMMPAHALYGRDISRPYNEYQ
jgi:hypothetical protein